MFKNICDETAHEESVNSEVPKNSLETRSFFIKGVEKEVEGPKVSNLENEGDKLNTIVKSVNEKSKKKRKIQQTLTAYYTQK